MREENMSEIRSLYKMSYKFNAAHYTGGNPENTHVHTFRLRLLILRLSDEYVDFYDYENKVKALVDHYRGNCINDFDEFSRINPTIENMGIYLFNTLGEMFKKDGILKLAKLDLGDSPTQSFSVSDTYVIGDVYRSISREKLLKIIGKE